MKQEDIEKALQALGRGGITVNGDLVIEKHVAHEVGNVEAGGIGIQNVYHGTEAKTANTEGQDEQEADGDDPAEELQKPQEDEPNLFVPKKRLQELLRNEWFAEVRSDAKYDAAWTDSFVEALMASGHGEGIARQWAVTGWREKKMQLKGYVVGLLKDAGIIQGSYDAIARQMGISDPKRRFSRYMASGKKQPYAAWVKEWIEAADAGKEETSEGKTDE